MGTVSSIISWSEEHPGKTAFLLLLFHLSLSGLMYAIACSPYLASMHNGHGLWNFSMDSFGYHQEALRLLTFLQSGDIASWWNGHSGWAQTKWIALTYFLFAPYPIAFAPVNALTWLATVFVVHELARLLTPGNRNLAAFGTMFFALMPTYLLQTTQLLRDPLYILGVSVMLLGFVRFLCGRSGWQPVFFVAAGLQWALFFRPYMQPIFVMLVFLVLATVFLRVPTMRLHASITAGILFLLLYWNPFMVNKVNMVDPVSQGEVSQGEVSQGEVSQGEVSQGEGKRVASSDTLLRWLNRIARGFQTKRNGFYGNSPNAGSKVDADVRFVNWADILKYAPRALAIGLLAPFPSDWLKPAYTAGKGARLLAGAEMLLMYMLMVGFLLLLFNSFLPLRLRIFLLIFAVSVPFLLGMAVPNIGAIYRMRYAFLLPIILGGVQGWRLILNRGRPFLPTAKI